MRLRLPDRSNVSQNVSYLAGADHIRAFAVLLMILYHGYQQIEHGGFRRADIPFESVLVEGHTAVAMFMVLSGFIFTYGALDAGEVRYGTFIGNRALRILPMYILVVMLAMYTSPGGYTFEGFLQLFTLQATPPLAISDFGPFGALLWTISVEFTFYLVFPFLLRFLVRYGPLYLVGLIVMMNLLRGLSTGFSAEQIRDISYWTFVGRIDQFLFGMLIGWLLVRRPPVVSRTVAWLGVVLSLVVVVIVMEIFNREGGWPTSARWKAFWPSIEGAMWSAFILSWIVASRSLSRTAAGLIALPGIVSYSAYLLHYAVVVYVRDRGPLDFVANPNANAMLNTLLIVVPVTFALATLTFLLVERPFMDLRHRYLPGAKSAAPSIDTGAS